MAAWRSRSPDPPAGNPSGRKVFCVKFQKELPGLDMQPWPGPLGQRVYANVSAEAWKLWEERMKMILPVPADAVAERGAAAGRDAHGGILLRRRRGVAARYVPHRPSQLPLSAVPTSIVVWIVNDSRACAARTAASASAAAAALAKMNPR